MNALVVYASRYGNTRKVAEAIAGALESRATVTLLPVEEAPAVLPDGTDLLLVGGPTEGHRMTEAVRLFLERLAPHAVGGVPAAAFDTRLHAARWLTGSAAAGIERELRRAGARLAAPAESFFVARDPVLLLPGELERAETWAAGLAGPAEVVAAR